MAETVYQGCRTVGSVSFDRKELCLIYSFELNPQIIYLHSLHYFGM